MTKARARLPKPIDPDVIPSVSLNLSPDVILSAAAAERGTLRPPTSLMPSTGLPALHAVQALLASVQRMKILARSPGALGEQDAIEE